jgi:hypothetical protein
MLFDLKGRRRRVVQGTYVLLALLMGGGLILFGIGGGTSGGLLDAFKGGGGGSNANSGVEKEIARAQRQLARNPRNENALSTIIQDHYRLARSSEDPNTGAFTSDGKQHLQSASAVWQRYLAQNPPKPNPTLATYMLQVYGQLGLNQPARAEKAAEIVAATQNNSSAYVAVVQYATLAGDKRTADLAAQKALDLAPAAERSSVKSLVKQARAATTATSTPSGGGSGG